MFFKRCERSTLVIPKLWSSVFSYVGLAALLTRFYPYLRCGLTT